MTDVETEAIPEVSSGESCRVLGYGARLTGHRLAVILGIEGVFAAAMAVGVVGAAVHQSMPACGPAWFGSTPGWGGIAIGGGGVAWAMVVSAGALMVLAAALFVAAATAWLPPLDPGNRRVALAAGLISGQPIIWAGAAIGVVLVAPFVTGNATVASAATGWHWVDEALMGGALVIGACVGWRACIASASAPHRTQIIATIFAAALLVFVALYAAGVTRVPGGGVAPAVSPGSILSHAPLRFCRGT